MNIWSGFYCTCWHLGSDIGVWVGRAKLGIVKQCEQWEVIEGKRARSPYPLSLLLRYSLFIDSGFHRTCLHSDMGEKAWRGRS
jgi:hypothetical protein